MSKKNNETKIKGNTMYLLEVNKHHLKERFTTNKATSLHRQIKLSFSEHELMFDFEKLPSLRVLQLRLKQLQINDFEKITFQETDCTIYKTQII